MTDRNGIDRNCIDRNYIDRNYMDRNGIDRSGIDNNRLDGNERAAVETLGGVAGAATGDRRPNRAGRARHLRGQVERG